MLAAGKRRYGLPDPVLTVDSLPELSSLDDRRFAVVLCAAVLQHIGDEALLDAVYRLRSLVAPGGFLVLSVPVEYPLQAPSIDHFGRHFRLRPPEQYTFFMERLGLKQFVSYDESDGLGRPDRKWRVLVYSAGEGSELRPVETIESILWDDRKVTTYKFALVRSLAHLAVHRHRAARWHDDGRVSVDIDDVATLWIRYYWPLVLPAGDHEILQGQRSKDSSRSDMGFRADLRTLAGQWERQGGYAAFRAGLESGRLAAGSQPLLKDVMRKVKSAIRQPIRYAGNERTGKMLFSYAKGRVYLPGEIWTELALMGRWIEDSVIIRWAQFSGNMKGQNRLAAVPRVLSLLLDEPSDARETNLARSAFMPLLEQHALTCAWTDQTLQRFDVDHAIPWALWRDNDLWNLLPVDPKANNEKRARIPTRARVLDRKPAIVNSWTVLYEAYRPLFLAHAGAFTGTALNEFPRSAQDALFDAFKDAIEYTAINRGVARW